MVLLTLVVPYVRASEFPAMEANIANVTQLLMTEAIEDAQQNAWCEMTFHKVNVGLTELETDKWNCENNVTTDPNATYYCRFSEDPSAARYSLVDGSHVYGMNGTLTMQDYMNVGFLIEAVGKFEGKLLKECGVPPVAWVCFDYRKVLREVQIARCHHASFVLNGSMVTNLTSDDPSYLPTPHDVTELQLLTDLSVLYAAKDAFTRTPPEPDHTRIQEAEAGMLHALNPETADPNVRRLVCSWSYDRLQGLMDELDALSMEKNKQLVALRRDAFTAMSNSQATEQGSSDDTSAGLGLRGRRSLALLALLTFKALNLFSA